MDLQPSKVVDFHYEFLNFDDKPAKLIYPVEIPYWDSPDELAHRIVADRMDSIMKFLQADRGLKVALRSFIEEENQRFYDGRDELLVEKLMRGGQVDVDALAIDLEKSYKDEILEYADRVGPSDEEIFAQSYHQLVHSSVLSEILAKERDYAKTITNLAAQMTQQINTMNTLHQEEIDSKMKLLDISVTSENINHILAKQYNMQNMIRKQCESELESTRGHQKYEYRDWITTHIDASFLAESDSPTQIGNRWSMISTQGPSMEESFTIHLGSQLKHMHNIRILSTKISELCSPLYSDTSFGGPNVALGLYSSSLCGIVVLTPSGSSVSPDSEIRRNANMSTEFHFDQVDHQIEKIQDDLRRLRDSAEDEHDFGRGDNARSENRNSGSQLKPGDVFITRHSNLSHSHVIFHLISDETFQSPSEINSRHPVILGLRNILKISSRHDVTTLSIPALLRHHMSEDMTVSWCIRRAELVFKCAKGFMIESASWGGAELNTLQLLLPYDISEELFRTLADMVPHVFRVANPKILQ